MTVPSLNTKSHLRPDFDRAYSFPSTTSHDEEMNEKIEEGKKGMVKRLGFSKSMQSLRGKAKLDKRMEETRKTRALGSKENMSNPHLPVLSTTTPPVPSLPQNTHIVNSPPVPPIRPMPVTQKSGGLSSFIRKLTGRSSPSVVTPSQSKFATNTRTNAPSRSATAPVASRPSARSTISPQYQQHGSKARDELPTTPTRVRSNEAVNPADIPLPPSPTLPVLDFTSEPEEDMTSSLSAGAQESISSPVNAKAPVKRTQNIGMLSLEGVGYDAEEQLTSTIEEGEVDDQINPLPSYKSGLAPIRIPSRGTNASPSPPTAVSEKLLTPTSDTSSFGTRSPPGRTKGMNDRRQDSVSPKAQVPVSTSLPTGLGRKESKWRKSMMDLQGTLGRRTSKAPPTSYDAYLAHQQRMAQTRMSCAPTFHSRASVAAEALEIQDKEAAEMADTFFLS
ncbi:hypothetical protein M231_03631 [Tremella mesenterica]|uniref:Uncharacterized protein n=1 Tax=Tremella mesenterica TaxID=5217 RepID=A0A4Q1BMT0_TREME|nr:hypothetical protein M231_03631 [Tremella mesenterica]